MEKITGVKCQVPGAALRFSKGFRCWVTEGCNGCVEAKSTLFDSRCLTSASTISARPVVGVRNAEREPCTDLPFDLLPHFERAAGQAAIFEFKITQIRKCGGKAKQIAIPGVDAGHERLDQILVRLPSQPAADKGAKGFIAIDELSPAGENQVPCALCRTRKQGAI